MIKIPWQVIISGVAFLVASIWAVKYCFNTQVSTIGFIAFLGIAVVAGVSSVISFIRRRYALIYIVVMIVVLPLVWFTFVDIIVFSRTNSWIEMSAMMLIKMLIPAIFAFDILTNAKTRAFYKCQDNPNHSRGGASEE